MYSNLSKVDKKIIQHNDLKIDLMEHQKTIIYYMNKLERNGNIKINNFYNFDINNEINSNVIIDTNIGIFSDSSGTGKSLSIVGLLTESINIIDRNINETGSKFICIKKNLKKIKV